MQENLFDLGAAKPAQHPKDERQIIIQVDCNNPDTGKHQELITSFEAYVGEEKIFALWDERAGLTGNLTRVKVKPGKLHFWEEVPGVSVEIIERLEHHDAPCWERFVIRLSDLVKLLNWFGQNGNFSWESGPEWLAERWEEYLGEEDLTVVECAGNKRQPSTSCS